MKTRFPSRWPVAVLALSVACGEANGTDPRFEPAPIPCETNLTGVPILALEWSSLRQTFLLPDHEASMIGIDYLVSPRAHVDTISLEFDFDRLTPADPITFEGECPRGFPMESLTGAVPEGSEDIVRATVVASSESGPARTGRIFVSTGSSAIEIRTQGLDAGDPADGDWWALYEPAPGNARLVIVPATLDRTSFRLTGLPVDQPGIVALIQTRALTFDAATRTIYAPWGFAGDWRRFAVGWYGAVFTTPPTGLVELATVVPPGIDILSVHRVRSAPALTDGATRDFRVLSPGEEDRTISIACDVSSLTIDVLSFVDVTIGDRVAEPGESITIEGACEPEATSWPLTFHSRSWNGRSGAILLRRIEQVSP